MDEQDPDWLRDFHHLKQGLIQPSDSPASSFSVKSNHGMEHSFPRGLFNLPSTSTTRSACIVEEEIEDASDEDVVLFSSRRNKHKKLAGNGETKRRNLLELAEVRRFPENNVVDMPIQEYAANFFEKEMQQHKKFQDRDNQGEHENIQNAWCYQEDEVGKKGLSNSKIATALPLFFTDKVHKSKLHEMQLLVECEGDALELSGDIGAIGRISNSRDSEMDEIEPLIDLKGIIYKATIIPSNSFFLVNIGQFEAKVEAVMNEFMQLTPDSYFHEMETMIEGTLEDIIFDSDVERRPAVAREKGPSKTVEDTEDGFQTPKSKGVKTVRKNSRSFVGTARNSRKAGNKKVTKRRQSRISAPKKAVVNKRLGRV